MPDHRRFLSRGARRPLLLGARRLCCALLAAHTVALAATGPAYAAEPVAAPAAAGAGGGEADSSSVVALGRSAPATDGILLSREELMALPTSGPGWEAIISRVEDPYGGSYTLGERDDANKDVLAHALAGARLDDAAYKTFVRDKVEQMMTAPRNTEDLLATLRHLQTYVISADLIDLATFDPELDARFRPWLADEIRFDYEGGGGGGSVISNHDRKPNNYGTHAGATRIAAALYLGDEQELQAARDIWYGWATGDPEFSHDTRRWTGTDWQCDPDRPAGINAAGCTRDGNSIDGVLPEDQERCGEFSWPPCETNYIHGAADGMTLSFWMLARQGEDPWAWGNQAALRQMQWKYAVDQPPYDGFRWQIPVIESVYGVDLPGNAPQATSTNFGYADWWAQASAAAPAPDPGTDSPPPADPDPEPDPDASPGQDLGSVVGIVVAVLAAGVLVVVAVLLVRRRRS